jgi:methyltransferase (TIGR00027 family)
VALARATLDRPATPTGDPEGERALAASLIQGAEWPVDLAQNDGRAWRGVLGFIQARTAFFDHAVVSAIDRGVKQVVILGAGYDGRALRFRTPGVQFFEVDHPATQTDKRRRLTDLDLATTGITFVEADFTEPTLEQRLADAGHQPYEQTQFLLEGVLRYLPEQAVHDLLATVRRRAAAGSELAVSIATRRPAEDDDAVAARLAYEQLLADAGEAVLTVPSRDVALGWLTDAGWTIGSVADLENRPGRLLVQATT